MTFYVASGRDSDGASIRQAFSVRGEAMKAARAKASTTGHAFTVHAWTWPRITKQVMIGLVNDVRPRPYSRELLATFTPGRQIVDGGARRWIVRRT